MELMPQKNVEIEDKKPIITVKEARKILGSEAKGLSDQEVSEQIRCLAILAKRMLIDGLVKNPEIRKNA